MISEDDLRAIVARLAEACPNGNADLGSKAARDFIEEDGPALVEDAKTLREALQTALGALADIANMSPREVADGVPQRKAKRIYDALLPVNLSILG